MPLTASSISRLSSKTSLAAAVISVKLPSCAPEYPPLTGVSIKRMPVDSSFDAISRTSIGLMVAVINIVEPGDIAEARPSSPNTTAFA